MVKAVLDAEARGETGILGLVFVDHVTSRRINREFMAHDEPTDVIAFRYDDGEDETWGEIYVNVERAREQSLEYGVSYENELARLIIHGLLHLFGYDDRDAGSRSVMREREDGLVERFYAVLE
ncbi:MAG TPA: rRNA maturation RNase YbeY [bacterium]|nr:rRNA maturation RNase YbeY [bacterium]